MSRASIIRWAVATLFIGIFSYIDSLMPLTSEVLVESTPTIQLPTVPDFSQWQAFQNNRPKSVPALPVFGSEINKPADIKSGEFLFVVGPNNYTQEILVLTEVYAENGVCQFNSINWSDGMAYYPAPEDNYCSDFGLTPRENGKIDKTLQLMLSPRLPMPANQLDELKQNLMDPNAIPPQFDPGMLNTS